MKRLRDIIREPLFGLFALVCGSALLGWPMISATGAAHPEAMFRYIFFWWGVVILLLFLMSRSYPTNPPEDGEG